MAAHRYWRVIGTSGAGSISAAEIGFNASGVRLVPSSATASSSFSGSFLPANAIDNNANTLWAAASADSPATFTIDFGSAVNPDALYMWARNDAVPDQTMNAGNVYYSDDNVTFTNLTTFSFAHPWTLGQQQTVSIVPPPSNSRINQFSGMLSVTQTPNSRINQFLAIVSVSPGMPMIFAPINIKCNGPLTLSNDMIVAKKAPQPG